MKTLTQEDYNNQLVTLTSNFERAGLPINDDLLHRIMISPAALNEDSGVAFPGGLAIHINLITAIALKLAKMVSGTFSIDETSICKVCICQHLGKLVMYVANDNQWEIDKRGINYKFNDLNETRLKLGDKSLIFAQNELHTTFNEVEWFAMKSMDNDIDDKYGRSFDPILATVIRQANELAYSIEKERNKS